MSELSDKDQKAVIVQILQQSLTNSHDTNEKLKDINQETEAFLKEANGNQRTEFKKPKEINTKIPHN